MTRCKSCGCKHKAAADPSCSLCGALWPGYSEWHVEWNDRDGSGETEVFDHPKPARDFFEAEAGAESCLNVRLTKEPAGTELDFAWGAHTSPEERAES